jgi:hypothetical protein
MTFISTLFTPWSRVVNTKPDFLFSGRDGSDREAVVFQVRVHSPVDPARADRLEGNQQYERKKEPGEEPEAQQALPDREVIHVGGFERCIVGGVDAEQLEPHRSVRAVDEVNPYRLHSLAGHPNAEEAVALLVAQRRRRDIQTLGTPGHRPVQERLFVRIRVVGHGQPPQWVS